MAPTQEEAKKLAAWLAAPANDLAALSPPERFLAVMAEAPRMGAKSGVLLFCAQLPSLLEDVRLALSSLHAACAQVLPCALSLTNRRHADLSLPDVLQQEAMMHADVAGQVRGSERLRTVLAAALRVGNAVNQGTHLGGAAAVRLESLLKMADLRVHYCFIFSPHCMHANKVLLGFAH
jgi:hypothetical protein